MGTNLNIFFYKLSISFCKRTIYNRFEEYQYVGIIDETIKK